MSVIVIVRVRVRVSGVWGGGEVGRWEDGKMGMWGTWGQDAPVHTCVDMIWHMPRPTCALRCQACCVNKLHAHASHTPETRGALCNNHTDHLAVASPMVCVV